jgi:hypothetical protein
VASIRCAQLLWRALLPPIDRRAKRRRLPSCEVQFQNLLFSAWAATLTKFDGRSLVVGVELSTYLSVVFALHSASDFRHDFGTALGWALNDLGASPPTIAVETILIETAPIVRLADKNLSEELRYTAAICEIELSYSSDLRRVQRNLNDLPHGGRDIPVPAEAVAARLAESGASSTTPH